MKALRPMFLAIAMMALVLMATSASADTFTNYNITNGTTVYGTISTVRSGSTLTVTITMASGFSIQDDGQKSVSFDKNGSDGTYSSNVCTTSCVTMGSVVGYPPPGGSAQNPVDIKSGQNLGGGLGTFGVSWGGFTPGSTATGPIAGNFTQLKFTLTGITTADGFAIHVSQSNGVTFFVGTTVTTTGDCGPNGCGTGGCTEDCGGTQTPEPASLILLGSGLLSIGGISRKRFSKKA